MIAEAMCKVATSCLRLSALLHLLLFMHLAVLATVL
jgi:hypothetical protein